MRCSAQGPGKELMSRLSQRAPALCPGMVSRASGQAGWGGAPLLTIRLTVQPIFLFSVSSPFMQSLGGETGDCPTARVVLWAGTEVHCHCGSISPSARLPKGALSTTELCRENS